MEMDELEANEQLEEQGLWVTIVTSRVYTKQSFIEEANRLGVKRAIQARFLKQMTWGEPILLADFHNETGRRRLVFQNEIETLVSNAVGVLEIFGYFNVEIVSKEGIPLAMQMELNSQLDVIYMIESSGEMVCRRCGSYVNGGGLIIKNSIVDIVEKAEALEEKYGVKTKWFIGGRFNPIPTITVSNQKYFRGYKRILIAFPIEAKETDRRLEYLKSYQRRRYMSKAERESSYLESFL